MVVGAPPPSTEQHPDPLGVGRGVGRPSASGEQRWWKDGETMKYGGIFHGKYMYFIEHVWKILENMAKNIGKYGEKNWKILENNVYIYIYVCILWKILGNMVNMFFLKYWNDGKYWKYMHFMGNI